MITKEMYIELMDKLGYDLMQLGGDLYHCVNRITGFQETHEIDDIHKHVLEDISKQQKPAVSAMTDEERETLSKEIIDIAHVDQSVMNSLSFLKSEKKYPGLSKNSMFKAALEGNTSAYYNLTELSDYVIHATGTNWKDEEDGG